MAVRKKENKADNLNETEVLDNGLQDNKEVGNKEVTKKADTKEEVGEETFLTDNSKTDTHDKGGDTVVMVDTSVVADSTPKAEKMVKIKPNCNYRFYYGTTWYVLCKDTVMTVPLEVKERLQKSGKLSAL